MDNQINYTQSHYVRGILYCESMLSQGWTFDSVFIGTGTNHQVRFLYKDALHTRFVPEDEKEFVMGVAEYIESLNE